MQNHIFKLILTFITILRITSPVTLYTDTPLQAPDEDLKIDTVLPYVEIPPWPSDLIYEEWQIPIETKVCGDLQLQENDGHAITTIEEISDLAYKIAPMLSDLIEDSPPEWFPMYATLYDYSVWLVRYMDRVEYADKIENEIYISSDLLTLPNYVTLVYISACDGHIIDVTDRFGNSICVQATYLSREPGSIPPPYPTLTRMVQKGDSLPEELNRYDKTFPEYSVGIEKVAYFEDEALQTQCLSYAAEHTLSTPDDICKYSMVIDAALKSTGHLEEKWKPTVQVIYSDGYAMTTFCQLSNRPALRGERYQIYFSLDDGHIIAIRHIRNGWQWDDGTEDAVVHCIL